MAQADRPREPAPQEKPLLRCSRCFPLSGLGELSAFFKLSARAGERERDDRRRDSAESL